MVTKYVYDGDHCIAEYTGLDQLRRKYIYGPGVDQPISMIEAASSYAGTYYYHFDGLGSVVGLTNSSGNTVEVYEYDVYGHLGATDASHPNRIIFTGREYDKETGLYYYRARYYTPQIGRFLQTDPVGYEAGMNMYRYCGNNPVCVVDPLGLEGIALRGYKSADEAALWASSSILKSGDLSYEHCYYIYTYLEDPTDPCSVRFGFTDPVKGHKTGYDVNDWKAAGQKIPKAKDVK